jgi:hypothetical protein
MTNEILGSDLQLANGDLVIRDGDFVCVEGISCLNQDLESAAETYPGENTDVPWEGILSTRQVTDSDTGRAKIIRSYNDMLEADPRIVPSSITVSVKGTGESASFIASFTTIDNQVVENFIL